MTLSKAAKNRLKRAKRAQLKAISDAVDLLASFEIITMRRAAEVDRFIERQGGRR